MAESLSSDLEKLVARAAELDGHIAALQAENRKLLWQRGVLWEVVREGLPKGDVYYKVVASIAGQAQADHDRERAADGVTVTQTNPGQEPPFRCPPAMPPDCAKGSVMGRGADFKRCTYPACPEGNCCARGVTPLEGSQQR